MKILLAAFLALVALGLQSRAARIAPPTFKVQVLALPASQPSAFPKAMSEDGIVAGHFGTDPWDNVALPAAVTATRTVFLPKPFDSLNFALGTHDANLVVGTSASMPVAWLGLVPRVLPAVAGLPNGAAYDANASGTICGTLYNDFTGTQIAVLWTSSGTVGKKLPNGTAAQGSAFAINDHGAVAGALSGGTVSNFEAARWDDPALAPALLGKLPGAMNSEVSSINADGDTAGRSSFPDFSTQAILHLRRTNTLLGLGTLSGTYSEAHGVNSQRRVVGTSSAAGGAAHAFLWQEGVLYDLNNLIASTSEPILYLSNAVAIDEKGRIAAEVMVASPAGPISKMALLTP